MRGTYVKCLRSPRNTCLSSPELTSDCQETSFQQPFSPETHCNTHDEGKRWETYLIRIWCSHTELVRCSLICELQLHTVISLASYVKCKMTINWAQVTQKKHQQTQVYVSEIYSNFVCIFLPFNNHIEFSYEVCKSFILYRSVSWKHAVIYAPNLCHLWYAHTF